MSKRGKNKGVFVIREPSGRLSRSLLQEIDALAPSAAKRLRDEAARRVGGEEYGTVIGHMFLAGELDEYRYEAGKRWARLMALYHKAVGAPPPSPKPQSLSQGFGKTLEPDPDSEEGREMTYRERTIIAAVREAHAVLMGAGMLAENAVRRACEMDEAPVGWTQVNALKEGLAWLSQHWGLTDSPSDVRRRA